MPRHFRTRVDCFRRDILEVNVKKESEWLVFEADREIVTYENIRLVCLLDLSAVFVVKTNADLTPISKLRDRSNLDLLVAH